MVAMMVVMLIADQESREAGCSCRDRLCPRGTTLGAGAPPNRCTDRPVCMPTVAEMELNFCRPSLVLSHCGATSDLVVV